MLSLAACGKLENTVANRALNSSDNEALSLAPIQIILYGSVKSKVNNKFLSSAKFTINDTEVKATINKQGSYRLNLPVTKRPVVSKVCVVSEGYSPKCANVSSSIRNKQVLKHFVLDSLETPSKPGFKVVNYLIRVYDDDYPSGNILYDKGYITVKQGTLKICETTVSSFGELFQLSCEIPLNKWIHICATLPNFLTECVSLRSSEANQNVTFNLIDSP
jgi:hypothetical protein